MCVALLMSGGLLMTRHSSTCDSVLALFHQN